MTELRISLCIRQFELIARDEGWSEQEKARRMYQNLVGSAATVLQQLSLTNTPATYANLATTLNKQFAVAKTFEQREEEFYDLKQAENQTVADFAKQIERVGNAYLAGETSERYKAKVMLKTFVRGLRSPEDVRTVTYTQPKSLEAAVDALAYSSTLQVAEPASTKKVKRAHIETSSSESETSGFPTTAETLRQQDPVMDKLTKILERIHPNSTTPNTSSESFQQANVQVTYPNSPDQQQWHYGRNPNSTAAPAQASHHPQFDTPQRGRGRPRGTFRGNSRGGYRRRRPTCEFCGRVGHATRECRRAARARALLDQQAPLAPGSDSY